MILTTTSKDLHQLRIAARNAPHSLRCRELKLTYLPPKFGPTGDPTLHYGIIVRNDPKATLVEAGYERP